MIVLSICEILLLVGSIGHSLGVIGRTFHQRNEDHNFWRIKRQSDFCDRGNGDQQIHRILTNGTYNKLIPPSYPVTVNMTFVLSEVTKVSEIEGNIQTAIILIRMWTDDRLKLDCQPPNGQLSIPFVLQNLLWQPEMFVASASSATSIRAPAENQRMEIDINGKDVFV